MKSFVFLIYLVATIVWAKACDGFRPTYQQIFQKSDFSSSSSGRLLVSIRQRRYSNAHVSCELYKKRRYKSWPSSSSSAQKTTNRESISNNAENETGKAHDIAMSSTTAGTATALPQSSKRNLWGRWKEFCARLCVVGPNRLWALKKIVRSWIEKYTIYVLECHDGKYYVGSTTNKKQRFKQHFSERGGSKWTRTYKPIRVLQQYKRIPSKYYLGLEAQVTAEKMLEFGVNNVRGAMFSVSRNYTVDDVTALTGFLGHYNELSYQDVEKALQQTLPPSLSLTAATVGAKHDEDPDSANQPSRRQQKRKRKKMRRRKKDFDRCWKCGKQGHYASECPTLED